MTTLYWDCFAGIAGNMAVGSLLDLGVDPARFRAVLSGIPFEEGPLELIIEERVRSGFRSCYFNTREDHQKEATPTRHDQPATHSSAPHDHPHPHAHPHDHDHPAPKPRGRKHGSHVPPPAHGHQPHGRSLSDIRRLLRQARLRPRVLDLAMACFDVLGEAEATIHGTTIEKIHFHEVGARDSIADIVGTAHCLDELGITAIHVSPVHLGSGMVTCRHGRIPIPGPATALLLRGFPVFCEPGIVGELTTPTGAALLRGLGAIPGFPPEFTYQAVGHGSGSFEFAIPNLLRAFLGSSAPAGRLLDSIVLLETNLDNVTGELLGHAVDRLMAAGALDVTLTAIQMKKGRPGTLLTVMCPPSLALDLENCLFRELPTLGIRRRTTLRAILERRPARVDTQFGPLAGKTIREIDGTTRTVVEFEARNQTARREGLPLRCVDERLAPLARPPQGKKPRVPKKHRG